MAEQYVMRLQQAVNHLRKKQNKKTIQEDGKFGNETLDATLAFLENQGFLLKQKATHVEEDINRNIEKPLPWVTEALKYKGMREIKGVRHNKIIIRMVIALGGWWRDDETPWCGVFVGHCLKETGRAVPRHWYRAKAYAKYGTLLSDPCYGCIGVMSRRGGGHVCIVIGRTKNGNLVVIGGNQNNRVSIAVYPRKRFTAFVFPAKKDGSPSLPYPYRYQLPVYDSHNLTTPISEA